MKESTKSIAYELIKDYHNLDELFDSMKEEKIL